MRQIIDPRTIDFSAWHGGISTTEEERGEWNNMYSAERTRSLNGYLDRPCDGEIKYLLPFMRQIQGPSLELASGAMRIMMQLALHGYEVHGIEGSPHMIELGQKKIATLPPEVQRRIHVIQGDMRDFSLGRTFGLIMIPFDSLWHNLNEIGAEQCIMAILKHLAPGGIFLIDTPKFDEKAYWWETIKEKFGLTLRIDACTHGPFHQAEMLVGSKKTK